MEQKKINIHNKTANSNKLNFVASRDFKLPFIILSSYYFKFLFQGCPKYTQKRERNNEVSGNSKRRRKEEKAADKR